MSNPSADNKTEMTKGNEGTDKLVAPKKARIVKLEILRDCEVTMPDGQKVIQPKGAVVEVTESEAKTLLSWKVSGCYGFTGERNGEQPKQTLRKARLFKERKSTDELESIQDEAV